MNIIQMFEFKVVFWQSELWKIQKCIKIRIKCKGQMVKIARGTRLLTNVDGIGSSNTDEPAQD